MIYKIAFLMNLSSFLAVLWLLLLGVVAMSLMTLGTLILFGVLAFFFMAISSAEKK